MNIKIKKYGWQPDLPDKRDFLFSQFVKVGVLPSKVDLRKSCSSVESQGDLGACTANALVGNLEFLEIKDIMAFINLSRLFVYYNERVVENTVDFDSGATLRDGIKTLKKFGVCIEKICPYIILKFTQKPSKQAYQDGKNHQIQIYMRLTTTNQMKRCLADGFPFVFGFTVYESFESNSVKKTGTVNLPEPDEKVLGGHAVCCLPNTTVITNQGLVPIENVKIGDFVLTHSGAFKKVTGRYCRDIEEMIYRIKNNFGEDLLVTKEHPLYAKRYSWQTKLTQTQQHGLMTEMVQWIRADCLGKGALLYQPIYENTEIFPNIPYEDDFFELLGMYIGDGNIAIRYSKNKNVKSMKLRFTLGKDYPELIDRCEKLLRMYSKNKVSEYHYKNCLIITCYDTKLAKKVGELCGFAHNKKIDWKILTAPISLQKKLIRGWYETDGCDIENGISIFTSKKNLLEEMTFILKRLKLIFFIQRRKSRISKINGKFCNCNAAFNVSIMSLDSDMNQKRTKHRGIYEKQYLISKITNVPVSEYYKGKVYNLEVENDQSYTANGIAVHNCAVGYDDKIQRFVVRNSWGIKWGMKGYFTMPYEYLADRNLSDDFWTIRKGENV